MTLPEIVLALGALGFAAFGILLLVKPSLMRGVGIPTTDPNARVEIRAMYGGLELGIAIFLLICITHQVWLVAGLTFQLLTLGGLGAVRLLAIAVERGKVRGMIWFFAALELALAALSYIALHLVV